MPDPLVRGVSSREMLDAVARFARSVEFAKSADMNWAKAMSPDTVGSALNGLIEAMSAPPRVFLIEEMP